MKKQLIAMALAGASATLALPAQAFDYATAQVAISDVNSAFDNGLSLVLTGGKDLMKSRTGMGFSIEGEFTKSIVNPEYDYRWSTWNDTLEIDYYTLGGYGVVSFPLTPQFALRGKAGLLYKDVDWDMTDFRDGTVRTYNDDGIEFTAGAGAVFKVSSALNLIAEYTVIDENIDHLSAGAQFRF